jgi:glycosyltransferase involved in cell wall biosynthesis
MDPSPNITFIICTYNRAEYLDDTLHSMSHQSVQNEVAELLVVNNNSTDHTDEIAAKHRENAESTAFKVSYFVETEQGLSFARNRGIKEAASENIVFVDDDIRADQHFIENWIKFFENYPNYNSAGGKILVQFDDHKPKWVSHYLLSLFGHHDLGKKVREYPGNKYPFGGNMGFRKKLFDEAGLFDTDLGRKGDQLTANEEKDLFNRVKSLGEPILYLPKALLHHRIGPERATQDYIRKQAEGMGKSVARQTKGSFKLKLTYVFKEIFKTAVSLGLFLIYLIGFTPAKGTMLLKFRYWILKGYTTETNKSE